MSLTIALVLAALAVLAALGAHGWWSARRATPREASGTLLPQAPAQRVEPTLGDIAETAPLAGATASATARRGARIDALIDAIATVAPESPLAGEAVIAHLPPTRRAGGKPLLIEGLNDDSGEWEPPRPGARYRELQAAVQLANRAGALNEIEYSEFVQKAQAFADALGAPIDMPDMLDAVARARELDGFASPHDANLAAHLQARAAAWSVGYVRQCAERHGFVAGALPGRLVLPAAEEGAPPLLALAFDAQAALAEDPRHAAVHRVTLTLDVPQTAESAEPFAAWQQAIRALAAEMDADVLDDDGRAITLQHYGAIAAELKTLYQALAARDMAAGSAVARRLFQ
jgi:ZipA, C-terminal FtsZ-binding domain